jgi:GntR family transcriptional regulator/MocR family aminotransferase
MRDQMFRMPADTSISLQSRIRQMLVTAILDGHIPPGSPLPSGRHLAQQLNVARNTVVLVYQQLVDEGYLTARERSGYYVNQDILAGRICNSRPPKRQADGAPKWSEKLAVQLAGQRNIVKPVDWQRYPYPFVYGQSDPALFPVADWRESCRKALSVDAIKDWSRDRMDRDDPLLIEQIHTRVLPRRGVWAAAEEILVTVGAQQALYLIARLLFGEQTTVGIEDPGYVDARNIFALSAGHVLPLPVDAEGMIVDKQVTRCDYVLATPSHQYPTEVTMPVSRRRDLLARAGHSDFVIVEDDYEAETNFLNDPSPALKSLDQNERVIYVGSISKSLAPGLRVGFMVGSEDLIREARALRRLMLRHPPSNNQRTVAHFLAQGHYDSLMSRLNHTYRDRWRVMGECLSRYLPESARIPTFGGTSYWVCGPEGLDATALAHRAQQEGILIEAGDVYYFSDDPPRNYFRLGFSSIPVDRIEPGIRKLAELVRALA